jgi:DNA-binding HxlR family transcriptional regulator
MATDDIDVPGVDENRACFCPLTGLLDLLARKYAMQVVCAVGAHGTARFSEVEAGLPDASTSTLSARLDELEAEGIVTRTQYDEVPPRVEYELTDDGQELCARLLPLLSWVGEREGLVSADEGADRAFDLAAFVDEVTDLLESA